VGSGERPFRCLDCAKSFADARALTTIHYRAHTGGKLRKIIKFSDIMAASKAAIEFKEMKKEILT
jgi:hypothetical protein